MKFLTEFVEYVTMDEMEQKLTSPFALLRQAWSLAATRSNIVPFLLLGAIPQLLSLSISAVLTYSNGRIDLQSMMVDLNNSIGDLSAFVYVLGLLIIVFGTILLISFITAWYTGLLYKVYQATAEGNLSPLSTYIRPAKAVTIHLLVTYFTVGLFTSVGFLLFIIPGIIIAVRYMFAPMIAAIEDRSVKPLDESKRLVKRRFWKLVGRGLLLVICYNVPLSILKSIYPLAGSAWAITSPVFGLYFYLVYTDFKRTASAAA